MMLSETDKKFAEAVHIFQNLPQELRPTQEEELEFYGLYKRAVVGKCNIPKPDFFNILALAKWEAWKKLDNLSMLKAREVYVEQLIKLLERFPDRPDVVELLDTFTKLHLNDSDVEVVSTKSQGKTNTINSTNSDVINNEYSLGDIDNQHSEYATRNVSTNQSNSINLNNASMNSSISGNIMSPGMPRNNNSQSSDDIININNSNRSTTRNRSRTDGSIYNTTPADISLGTLQPDDPASFRSDNTFIPPSMNNPAMNPKITSPLHPTMSPLNPNGMGMGMGIGMNMNNINMNNPNAKIAASTSMSIVMLTRLRDLEIEVSSLNTRLNMLSNIVKNNSKNTLQNWLKFILRTCGANIIIFLFMILILGPSGYEKVIGHLPAWLIRLQSRYLLNSKSNAPRSLTEN